MESGSLRESIAFIKPPEGKNKYGGPSGDWTEVLRTRASFDPIIGREYFQAEQAQSQVEVKFRTRYRQDIPPNCRIRHFKRGAYLDYDIINVVNPEGADRELLFYAKKVTP